MRFKGKKTMENFEGNNKQIKQVLC